MEITAPSFHDSFKSWLQVRSYQPTTIRNYLADTTKFLTFTRTQNPSFPLSPIHIFSEPNLSAYLAEVTPDPNSKRYLASLNKFCQFALDQHLISQNPLKAVKTGFQKPPQTQVAEILNLYQTHLQNHHKTPSTVKNYLNDIENYINFLETNSLEAH